MAVDLVLMLPVLISPLRLCAAALAGLLAALVLAAGPAGAAFEGRNGALAYEGRGSEAGVLYLRNANGRARRRLRLPGWASDPAFSPQGRRIAFAAGNQIWVVNANGSGARQVTVDGPLNREPTWSPRGDELAFAAGATGGRALFRIGADGNRLTRLTSGASDDDTPAWSVGEKIAFVRHSGRGDGDLYVMGSGGGTARRLTGGRSDDAAPDWSPRGTSLLFTRGSPARRQVFRVRTDGSGLRRLTRFRLGVSSPTWSPDGRRIAFAMGRGGRRALYVMRSNGRGLRRLAAGAADPRSIDWQAVGADPVIAAAGDIACSPASPAFMGGLGTNTACRQRLTSDLLLKMDLAKVLALGDLQYENGELANSMESFDPSWGRVKSLIRPVVGNHEARDPGTAGYFDYFNGPGQADGPAGPRPAGYYAYDVGAWHIVALNSQCSHPPAAPTLSDCAAGSPQEQWLREDLAAHPSRCTLAYWHHPMLSSGIPGINAAVRPLWQALYDAGADVVLTGHDHGYERFAPMDPGANRDGPRGLRQFVVGTGGKTHQVDKSTQLNREVRENATFGVLTLKLGAGAYRWTFVPDGGSPFRDTGASACH